MQPIAIGVIDENGKEHERHKLVTDPAVMTDWLNALTANHKFLAVEEGSLTQWISWQLNGQVDDLLVCDPKENFWISRSAKKTDSVDAMKLARLLRMGELRRVWHPEQKNDRALFAAAAAHYVTMRREQVRLKHQIKSRFRRWGVVDVSGEAVYSSQGRAGYLEQLSDDCIHKQIVTLFTLLDNTVDAQSDAKGQMLRLIGSIQSSSCGAGEAWESPTATATDAHWATRCWIPTDAVTLKTLVTGPGRPGQRKLPRPMKSSAFTRNHLLIAAPRPTPD